MYRMRQLKFKTKQSRVNAHKLLTVVIFQLREFEVDDWGGGKCFKRQYIIRQYIAFRDTIVDSGRFGLVLNLTKQVNYSSIGVSYLAIVMYCKY